MYCELCKQDKDPSCFYKSYAHRCKECKRLYAKQYREKHLDRILVYDRNRPNAKERTEKLREYRDKMRVENPEKYEKVFRTAKKRYVTNHREKRSAENKLNNALRTGMIIRPNKCILCQTECKPQAHHYDYSKPLDVMWLCIPCHAKVHKEERAKQRGGRNEKNL